VTKTDETDALGTAYSVVRRAARPLAWLTDGQRVPEDIEAAEPAVLAARVVGEAAARVRLAG
jgi:flagellar biosynthesis protein FlhF